MSKEISYPLEEADLFSAHWDDDWELTWKSKHPGQHKLIRNRKDGGNPSQRRSDRGSDDESRKDKGYEDEDVEQIREEISKVIESVMRTSVDRDIEPAPSHFGIHFSSSPIELRHRAFPSRSRSSPRGMPAAVHLASSPPATFEIHHNQQQIRGREFHFNTTANLRVTIRQKQLSIRQRRQTCLQLFDFPRLFLLKPPLFTRSLVTSIPAKRSPVEKSPVTKTPR